ncbi:MAG TPA: SMI1/KNR4 family protein, partial [Isosphaeraceae bacterium]|nr:SMI1/KNR4 family protein [Isosphaeraceae bacterium]
MMNDFWVETGCLPGMTSEQTRRYIHQIADGYRANGNPDFAKVFEVDTLKHASPSRPGPSQDRIEAWEAERGFRLPKTLREALAIQDGGYVRGADLYVNPLEEMKPLSEGDWDHLWESSENQEFGDPEKLVILGSHESLGGILILDGNTNPEPRILYLWRDLGDELRDEGDTSFDDLVDRL